MICFEVHLNGERLALAGIDGFAVLSAILTWVRRRRYPNVESELRFSVGGLDSNEEPGRAMNWVARPLKPGDELRIRVVESDRPDQPLATEADDPKAAAAKNRAAMLRYVERARREAADLRAQIARRDGKAKQLNQARRRVAFLVAEIRRVRRWAAPKKKRPPKKKR